MTQEISVSDVNGENRPLPSRPQLVLTRGKRLFCGDSPCGNLPVRFDKPMTAAALKSERRAMPLRTLWPNLC